MPVMNFKRKTARRGRRQLGLDLRLCLLLRLHQLPWEHVQAVFSQAARDAHPGVLPELLRNGERLRREQHDVQIDRSHRCVVCSALGVEIDDPAVLFLRADKEVDQACVGGTNLHE